MWYLASYPKSGNTWVRIFVVELLNLLTNKPKNLKLNLDICTGDIVSSRRWIDDQIGIDSSDLNERELDAIRFKIGSKPYIYSNSFQFHKVHDSFNSLSNSNLSIVSLYNCRGIIYIIRNPFDLAVSISHYYLFDYEKSIDFLTDPKTSICSCNDRIFPQVKQHLGRWDDHVKSWKNQNNIPILLIKYEDLIREPHKNFMKVSNFLSISNDQNLINQAIKRSAFSQLQKKERMEKGFVENSSKSSNFFRSGCIGEGHKKLNKLQIKRINKEFNDLLGVLGYDNIC